MGVDAKIEHPVEKMFDCKDTSDKKDYDNLNLWFGYRKRDHGSGGDNMVPVGIHVQMKDVCSFQNRKLMGQMDNNCIHYKKKPGEDSHH